MDPQAANLSKTVQEGFFKGKNHTVQMFRQLIQCHKEKYKYAKECNADRRFIVYKIGKKPALKKYDQFAVALNTSSVIS